MLRSKDLSDPMDENRVGMFLLVSKIILYKLNLYSIE
jgi:hypothetical protein